ncbi:NrdH-redoxin [Domibacillus antri]|uniref:NrdH-redoxin n=1 Tax=Domibacillus antri TaxID=1714264 RepID=A0A1Q8QA64_9BACI|nr:glutaredoxin family protein [Domibacillus antri]OLN24228.1 NrdH-redoxin [Domibacillus antri]
MDVFFYTRPNCHLCEEAKWVMKLVQEEIAMTLQERNIDESDEWTEKYGLMIPVVEYGGELVQYGQIDYVTVLEKLKQKVNK